MKTKIHIFQPGDKNDVPAVKQFWLKCLKLLSMRDFWAGLCFAASILFLFIAPVEVKIPEYKLGEIAQSTVRAPRDIQVPDTATTERKQREARDRVLPVYDYEPTLVNSSISRMHEVFVFLRTQDIKDKNFESLADSLRENLNVNVDPKFLAAAGRSNFSEDFERVLTQKLQKAMSQYIVTDRNVLFLLASKGLTVRNQETGREETLSTTSVQDVHDIQEMLK